MRQWIAAGMLASLSVITVAAVCAATLGPVRVDATAATLERAKQVALARQRSVAALDMRADHASTPGERAQWQNAAVAARVAAAEAELTVGRVRSGLITALLTRQRAQLTERQGPIVRLLAALASVARRPTIVALAQPGSLSDLVHAQAVLRAVLPQVEARTAALRDAVSRTRALDRNAAVAARELARGRSQLVEARAQLAALRGDGNGDGDDPGDERALALGEAARDAVDRLSRIGGEQAILDEVIALPGPAAAAPAARDRVVAYRLPVQGRLLIGLGELSDNGVVSRGLTFAVRPGEGVIAPAGGRIVFARPFRGYGGVVIIDHGDRWTSLITGLGALSAHRGDMVAPGAAIGQAALTDDPHITVELRRQGRPMDIAQLLG